MIDTERIDSQLLLSHGKAITSVDPGGLMIDTERIDSQFSLLCGKAIASVVPGGSVPPPDVPCEARVGH